MSETRRSGDIAVPPNWYIYMMDGTTGQVITHVGPTKTSPSDNDYPVLYDAQTNKYKPYDPSECLLPFNQANRNQYVVLTNPSKDKQPDTKGKHDNFDLEYGERIVIPGPIAFPLWPGQHASVIDGHHLRTNQYLIVRVYDEDAARESLGESVLRTTEDSDEEVLHKSDIITGSLITIKGVDVRFFIPSTGLEVLMDASTKEYVRDAVTLESLEYCVLISEDGEKRYVHGPDVVFPEPNEQFETDRSGNRKFKAIELNDNSGVYVKVIQTYADGEGDDAIIVNAGEELFITGKEQQFYFPRPEHSIVAYDNTKVHYAVAVPEGEGRYVLDRFSGEIELVQGPNMLLLDPRKKVFVKRALSKSEVELYFPGNEDAVNVNNRLRKQLSETSMDYLQDDSDYSSSSSRMRSIMATASASGDLSDDFMSDQVNRNTGFTKPRTITIDSKYDGAVKVKPWTGYAVMIVDAAGNRRVEVGPTSILLDYDEHLEAMSLSTGKPKTTDTLFNTSYLRIQANKISDIINVTTKDMIDMEIKVSYMVNFIGDKKEEQLKWFDIDNYVKYLCDHMRTMVKDKATGYNAKDLYLNYIKVVKEVILGNGVYTFDENNMEVYDVEVLRINILDEDMSYQLQSHYKKISTQELSLEISQKSSDIDEKKHKLKINELNRDNKYKELLLETNHKLYMDKHKVSVEEKDAEKAEFELVKAITEMETLLEDHVHGAKISRRASEYDVESKHKKNLTAIETDAVVKRGEVVSTELVAALTSMSETGMLKEMAQHLAPLAVVRGTSVAGVLSGLLEGTNLSGMVDAVSELRSFDKVKLDNLTSNDE